jgi:sirohydrochlorin ferrochelatase
LSAVSTPDALPPLLLVAHGSTDPRFLTTVEAAAARVCGLRPGLAVTIGLLDHGPPYVEDGDVAAAVAVPLLLSAGYHVRVDLPARAPRATVADAVGPDPRLSLALADRLREAGYDGAAPVTLAAAGSADPRSLDDVRRQAAMLSEHLGVEVEAAFLSAGEPRLADVTPGVVASYLLAPGAFHDKLSASGATVVSAPLGDHPALADVVLSRYDAARAAQVPGRTAPA